MNLVVIWTHYHRAIVSQWTLQSIIKKLGMSANQKYYVQMFQIIKGPVESSSIAGNVNVNISSVVDVSSNAGNVDDAICVHVNV
jgi:hypothetical protein